MAATTDSKPKATVFYSWQSDLPNATNRGLILDALERAAKKICSDDSVMVEPVLDRDTQNVPGAPDIAHTIFQKIEKADAFVADVSIINPGLGRPTPNPNVLLELGYALKTLGNARTVLVANTVNGSVEMLPFDLRTKRVLTYRLPPGAEDKPDQRRKLQEGLEVALRAILLDWPAVQTSGAVSSADKAIENIEKGASSQSALCTRFMEEIAERVRELTPRLEREKINEWDDQLVEAIRQSLPLVTAFARVAEAAAIHDSQEAAFGLFRGFAPLLAQYEPALVPEASDQIHPVQLDFCKFIGHEIMVILVAAHIRDCRWQRVAELGQQSVIIPNPYRGLLREPNEIPVTYRYASKHVALLEHRSVRLKMTPLALHASILRERHEGVQLGDLSPWQRFQDADVFLFLRSAPHPGCTIKDIWVPWSAALLNGTSPRYLVEATYRDKAKQLLEPLGVPDIDELRNRLKQAASVLHQIFRYQYLFDDPVAGLRPDVIGTK